MQPFETVQAALRDRWQTMWMRQKSHWLFVSASDAIGRAPRVVAAMVTAFTLTACAGAPIAQPPPDDCVQMRLWSNGWHVSIAMPAEALDEGHPLRTLFPDKQYFLVGWGARDFYMADKAGFFDGLFAIVPPTASAVHVIAGDEPVEETTWRPKELVDFAVAEETARAIADGVAASLRYGDTGAPIKIAEGRVPSASHFLAAKGQFHLFNMCNHWAARRLHEAGLPVRAGVSFTAGGLMRAVDRKTQNSCAAPQALN